MMSPPRFASPRVLACLASVASVASFASLASMSLALAATGCTGEEDDCILPYLIMPLELDARLPAGLEPIGTQLELCVGAACDTSIVEAAPATSGGSGGLRCRDVDGTTQAFPVQCEGRTDGLRLTVNTAYDGHEGKDALVLTAIDASGARTVLLRGEVAYTDATTPSNENVCGAPFYEGRFTPSP